MDFIIKVYDCYCSVEIFEINGIDADKDDFVDKYDHNPEMAQPYSCGNMGADVLKCTDIVLKKYGITELEYYKIAEDLQEKLHFGNCSRCS